jgi:selenocysteine lyase/cysteine desulfurase
MSAPSRREFFSTVGISSLAGLGWPAHAIGWAEPPEQYLFKPGLLYFNTGSIGPCSRKVIEATIRAWYELESEPLSMTYGKEGTTLAAAEAVRTKAARFLGCSADEIAITRSTTDGINAIAESLNLRAGQRVLTTDQEHEGGSMAWQYLAKRRGVLIDTIKIAPADLDASAIVQRFAAAITGDTAVVSVSHILSSTGLRMPIPEISALARSRGVLCVVDGAQAAGGVQVDVKALGSDAYATSGHKWLMAPKGTGILYISSNAAERIAPMQFDDGRSFYNHSTGVGNIPGAVGLGVAIDTLQELGMENVERHNLALRNRLHDALVQRRAGMVVSAPPGPLATPLLTLMLPEAISIQELANALSDNHSVIVKTVPKRWLNGIRLSTHVFNTEQQVDALVNALEVELAKARSS